MFLTKTIWTMIIKKIKNILNEIYKNPLTVYYYIQGNIRWMIHGRMIRKWNDKRKRCGECYKEGFCIDCSCSFDKIALTNKCKK